MVERSAVDRVVAGSSPVHPAKINLDSLIGLKPLSDTQETPGSNPGQGTTFALIA